ncbi:MULTISPECIES: Veg family protein [Phocicoccus]|uniref:Protein Veg n=2 Tax=Phocicoccus TaxID=3076175 RepID=A0A6V7R3K8_9BACL|nr:MULTISPECIES: Veg family protein [Jeotgalicoccus]HLR39871.1 Veg family protein [Jeotgalicoccus sp.]MBP1940111.1 uncharacterized protein Veg [Jeotgalicoccus pinnipedialis]CAD2070534.1 Protein Veg [Jeotgalicoccus schoeneichii]CAD2071941.1 Protein Veg [Jeotgalicoccus pinnipedialis]GGH54653.1 hypothetical protein GCM10007358_15230 [Jeotgalicoccus schoeneichii]
MPKTIRDIREVLEYELGNPVLLEAQGGRRTIIKRRGILRETHPAVFVVELDQEKHNFECVSYTYADILTKHVEVTVFNDDNTEKLVLMEEVAN